MSWPVDYQSSDKLDMNGSYQTIQASAADLEIEIPPGQVLNVLFDFRTGAGDEVADILAVRGLDHSSAKKWESDEEALRLPFMAHHADSGTYLRQLTLAGINRVKFRVRSRDDDDSAGSETDQDMYVYHALDGGV